MYQEDPRCQCCGGKLVPPSLTPGQMELLRLLTEGRSNREIAQALSVTTSTVGTRVQQLYEKLGTKNRTHTTAYALRHRLLEREPIADPARSRRRASSLLSPSELRVLSLAAEGKSNREIARTLLLSRNTVRSHIGRSLQKLGVRNRVQAVVLASEHHLLILGGEVAVSHPSLGNREKQVVQLIMEGKTDIEIARILSIAPGTVKTHIVRISEKIGVQGRLRIAVHTLRHKEDLPNNTSP